MLPPEYELGLALFLLVTGFAYVLVSENVVKMLLGVEIMSKGVLLNFLSAGYGLGEGIVVLVIMIDAAVVAVMMAMTVAVHRHYESLDVSQLRDLQW